MSAVGKEAVCYNLLLAALEASSYGTPPIPFAMPEIVFDPSGNPQYIVVKLAFNKPGLQSLDVGGLVQKMGLMELMVVFPKGSGIIQPGNVVSQIIADWPRGRVLFDQPSGIKLSITSAPYPMAAVMDDIRTSYPIIIPWQVLDHA